MLTKYLQYYGGAITAGYFPNPHLKKNNFDSGSCASVLYSYEIIEKFNFEEYKQLNELNYPLLGVPGVQLFFETNNLNRPLEYEIKPVDEIVYIYPALENLYIYYYQKTMTNLLMNLIRYLKNIKQNVTQIIQS